MCHLNRRLLVYETKRDQIMTIHWSLLQIRQGPLNGSVGKSRYSETAPQYLV